MFRLFDGIFKRLLQQLNELNARISSVETERDEAKAEVEKLTVENESLQSQLAASKEALDEQEAALEKQRLLNEDAKTVSCLLCAFMLLVSHLYQGN